MTDADGRVDRMFWHGSLHHVRTVQKDGYTVAYDLSPMFDTPPEQQKSTKNEPIVIRMKKTQ
jgi:hypothetical protein